MVQSRNTEDLKSHFENRAQEMYAEVLEAKIKKDVLCIIFQIEIDGTVKNASEIFNLVYQVTEKCKCEEDNATFSVGHFTSRHQWGKGEMSTDIK